MQIPARYFSQGNNSDIAAWLIMNTVWW